MPYDITLKAYIKVFYRAMAQVSCDIQQPKPSRPNEGMIYINVELTSLAAQHFESGRQSEISLLISRQLEKCFKDSRCIDLECLCIVADKKVTKMHNLSIPVYNIQYVQSINFIHYMLLYRYGT